MNNYELGAAAHPPTTSFLPDLDDTSSVDISNISKKENYLLDKIKFGDISMHKMAA